MSERKWRGFKFSIYFTMAYALLCLAMVILAVAQNPSQVTTADILMLLAFFVSASSIIGLQLLNMQLLSLSALAEPLSDSFIKWRRLFFAGCLLALGLILYATWELSYNLFSLISQGYIRTVSIAIYSSWVIFLLSFLYNLAQTVKAHRQKSIDDADSIEADLQSFGQ